MLPSQQFVSINGLNLLSDLLDRPRVRFRFCLYFNFKNWDLEFSETVGHLVQRELRDRRSIFPLNYLTCVSTSFPLLEDLQSHCFEPLSRIANSRTLYLSQCR